MLNLTANCLFETIFALPFILEISFFYCKNSQSLHKEFPIFCIENDIMLSYNCIIKFKKG